MPVKKVTAVTSTSESKTNLTSKLIPMPLLIEPPTWNKALSVSSRKVGFSVLGQTIKLFGVNRYSPLLVLAGVHGDEHEGMLLAQLLLHYVPHICILPCLNPDGTLLHQRWNQRNVDLNRNLPTPDWSPEPLNSRYPPGDKPSSEPENQALLKALKLSRATTILSLHSYKETLLEIERPLQTLTTDTQQAIKCFCTSAKVPLKRSIGYPTPGSLGSYARHTNPPLLLLTYELQRGYSHQQIHGLLSPLVKLINSMV